ncbi:type VII secretion integral membrane protein EccD [Nocardia sp. alder85J]|uniref:type VII secretion integral membrane protein EccD n=1 Tax=Nocardia sp. alder85J TaxID=2862949 RepID=UPI001CD795CD|nr:type VII secretion integral membrane protein EccD [Nocardia sp. alder85J]MCX4093090.1 type VII secretion integral membrane protein EccD [Nocardia sp. alder85J]
MIESTAIEPQLCRVSIIGGNTQVDMALPASIAIANFIPDVVEIIASRNPDLSEHDDGGGPLKAQHWTLSRLGHEPIEPHRSLTEAEVFDGELLVLRTIDTVEAPALFDDVIDAVARLTESSFRGWSSDAAGRAGLAAAVAGGLGTALLLIMATAHGWGIAAGGTGLGAGLLTLVAAGLAARMYSDTRTATALSLAGLILTGTGAALLVPGRLGSPQILLGCAATLLLTVPVLRLVGTGTMMFATLITVTVFGTASSAVTTIWHVEAAKVGAVVVICGLLGITMAPRVAVATARLPVPPVPTAGGVIDPRDHEQRPTIEGIGAIGATAIPSAAGLGLRSRLANDYQSGMLVGIVLAVVAGALAAAGSTEHRWQGVGLAVAAGLVLCRRARAFADLSQAAALVLGGCAILIVLPVLLGARQHELALAAAGALLVFSAGAVLFGVVGPRLEVSPVVQRLGEILEYLFICVIGPLAFWVLDIYSLARNA